MLSSKGPENISGNRVKISTFMGHSTRALYRSWLKPEKALLGTAMKAMTKDYARPRGTLQETRDPDKRISALFVPNQITKSPDRKASALFVLN